MTRIPDSDSLPKPSLDALRGRPDALAQAASGDAFGAGVFGAVGGFGQAVSDVANAERKRRAGTASITGRDAASAINVDEPFDDAASFGNTGSSDDAASDDAGAELRRNRNAALNELAVSLPHDFDLAIEDARGTMPPGGRGFTDAASKSIEAVRKERLNAALGKYALPKSDAADLDQRTQAFAALARNRARTFERREAERQFHLDTGRQVETLRRHVSEDPAKLPFVAAQVDGLYDNASEHLTRDQIAQDRASAQRAVHRAALDTQVERAPETVLNNLARDALRPLVRQGALDAADLTLARQRARRAVKRRAALEGATRRKAFAEFRANLEIAARRGEVGQKFIDRQHELGAITLSERNRYVGIAKRVRERREEAAAQRRELEALKAGGGTVGAAVLRGIRTSLDGLIAAGARDPELVRFALEAGAITKEGARERLERMRAGEAKVRDREALIERGRRADKEPLDPTNPQDRKAAELHYRRDVGPRIERLSSDPKTAKRAVREGAAFVEKTGVVPKAYAGQITRALASENLGIQAVGALHLHETLKRNPEAVPIVVGDKDTVFAVHAATLQEAGFDGPGAVKQATAAKETTPQQRDTHLEAYDLERERHERDNITFLQENGLTEAQAPKFNEDVRRLYGTTGNLIAARQLALAKAKRGTIPGDVTPTPENGAKEAKPAPIPQQLEIKNPLNGGTIILRRNSNGGYTGRIGADRLVHVSPKIVEEVAGSKDADANAKRAILTIVATSRLWFSLGNTAEAQKLTPMELRRRLGSQLTTFIDKEIRPKNPQLADRLTILARRSVAEPGSADVPLVTGMLRDVSRERVRRAGRLLEVEDDRLRRDPKRFETFRRRTGFSIKEQKDGKLVVLNREGRAVVEVPRSAARAIANGPERYARRLSFLDAVRSGNLSGEAMLREARKLFGSDLGSGVVVRESSVLAAVEVAQKALANGVDREKVFRGLKALILADAYESGKDFGDFLLDILPIVGNVRSARHFAVDIDKLEAAIKRGDWGAAAGHGLFAVLDGIGAIPLVGNAAKPVLKRFVEGILSIPGVKNAPGVKQLLKKLDDRALRKSHKRAREARRASDRLSENEWLVHGNNPSLRPTLNDKFAAKVVGRREYSRLTQEQRDAVKRGIETVLQFGSERLLAAKMRQFRKGTGDRIFQNLKFLWVGRPPGKRELEIDVTVFPAKQMAGIRKRAKAQGKTVQAYLRDKLKDAVRFQDILLVEGKAGKNLKRSDGAKALVKRLEITGRSDVHVLSGIPLAEIPTVWMVQFIKRSLKHPDTELETKLANAMKGLSDETLVQIDKGIRRLLPSNSPGWLYVDMFARVLAGMGREVGLEPNDAR